MPRLRYVDYGVFRPYSRRSRYAPIDWHDYRFHGPMRAAARPWGYRRRQHPLLRILIFLAIVWAVTRLIRGSRSSNWL